MWSLAGDQARLPWRGTSARMTWFRFCTLLFWAICACSSVIPETPTEDQELDTWIGQMLMVGFRGTELGLQSPFLQQLGQLNLGGVILFDYDVELGSPLRNIESVAQVRVLTQSLQSAARIPLLIAVDQEGGRISRFKARHGVPAAPSQAELGRRDEEEFTRQAARQIGARLTQLGVNLNLAPVVDLALNADNPVIAGLERSYGADPDLVGRHSRWAISEFHQAGLLVAIKHFPGHGSSEEDSHRGLPDVTHRWSRRELQPFRFLIAAGLPDLVMTAHLFNAQWDPVHPATLSSAVIQTLLREELGFTGVVISDDLQMAAIAENYSLEESIGQAIRAGIDILLFANNLRYDPEIATKAARILKRLVETGQLSRGRLRQSYQRILKLKNKLRY